MGSQQDSGRLQIDADCEVIPPSEPHEEAVGRIEPEHPLASIVLR